MTDRRIPGAFSRYVATLSAKHDAKMAPARRLAELERRVARLERQERAVDDAA